MKSSPPNIQAIINTELTALNAYINKQLQSKDKPFLNQLTGYVFQHTGKQLRAQLVFLMAGAYGNITAQTRRGAALVSLVHHASLIHDDIVDDACYRRGIRSANAIWGNKEALLVGDYLLSSGIVMAMEHQDYELLKMVANTVQAMSVGELLQLTKAKQLAMSEAVYLEIIHQKTAKLMGACCAIGALTANASAEAANNMYQIGEQLGMAFQLQNDWQDYGRSDQTDKVSGMDIQGKKITLPLLYALQKADTNTCQAIMQMIKHHSHDRTVCQEIIEFVHAQGGITYAQAKMYAYQKQALHLVTIYLPSSSYQESLLQLIQEVIP